MPTGDPSGIQGWCAQEQEQGEGEDDRGPQGSGAVAIVQIAWAFATMQHLDEQFFTLLCR